MNFDNRRKIEQIFYDIDQVNDQLDKLCLLEVELKDKYPRVRITWGGQTYNDVLDLHGFNYAVEELVKTTKETLHARLEKLIESLNTL